MAEPSVLPLEVRHAPNPCGAAAGPHRPTSYPFRWCYRTEVRNNTDRPLRVVQFQAFRYERGRWAPGNTKGRVLTHDDFRQWYGDGRPGWDGVIPPHEAAVCDPNWSGALAPWAGRMKWAYRAVDDQGREYEAEGIVRLRFVWNQATLRWLPVAMCSPLWIVGTALIVLSYVHAVSYRTGWIGFVIALTGAGLSTLLRLIQQHRNYVDATRAWERRCRVCGYDLRASTGRCPECGTNVEVE